MGKRLPEGVAIRAVEETTDTIYLVLPSASVVASVVGEGGELSDLDLEAVAGGFAIASFEVWCDQNTNPFPTSSPSDC
jgi:hypothetical protein